MKKRRGSSIKYIPRTKKPTAALTLNLPRLQSDVIFDLWQKDFLTEFACSKNKSMFNKILLISSLSIENTLNQYKLKKTTKEDIQRLLGLSLSKEGEIRRDYLLTDRYDLVMFPIFTEIPSPIDSEVKEGSEEKKSGLRGGHYSLLALYSAEPNYIYYYDSIFNFCLDSCKLLVFALQEAMLIPGRLKIRREIHYPQQIGNFECGYVVCGMIRSLTLHFAAHRPGSKLEPLPKEKIPAISDKQFGIIIPYIEIDFYTFLHMFFLGRWEGTEKAPETSFCKSFYDLYKHILEHLQIKYKR